MPRKKESAPRESPSRSQVDAEELLAHLSILVFDDIFWMQDLETGAMLYVSPSCERTVGVTRKEMYADPLAWLAKVVPEDRDRVSGALKSMEYAEFEVRVQHGGGTRWIRARTFPIRDGHGRAHRLVGVAEDITARRDTEEALRRSQTELLQAQKMEAVGRLAGGVAHDFNNILTVILGYSEHLLDQLKAGEKYRAELEQIKRAGERASSLTRQLLAFSRKQRLQPRLMDLNATVVEMDKMLRRLIGDDIEITLALASGLPPVLVDPGQMEQVVMNLCVNSRDAMDGGGKLTVETEEVGFEEDRRIGRMSVPAGRWVRLTVKDTGCGMDTEVLTRIFEPFFTTKREGKGTGLGLATTLGIVKQSGGHITVESEKGRGTAFHVYLPRAEGKVEVVAAAGVPAEKLRGSETVLLVEDEKPVRDLLRQTLAESGYRVLEAGSPAEALWLCERHHGEIDLLVSDIVMRQMSGYDVAERLERLKPEMRILFMSGYSERTVPERWAPTPFIAKPFAPHAFLQAVRGVLDR